MGSIPTASTNILSMYIIIYNKNKLTHRLVHKILSWVKKNEEIEMSNSSSCYFLPTVFGRRKKELQTKLAVFNTEKGWLTAFNSYSYIITYVARMLVTKAIRSLCQPL